MKKFNSVIFFGALVTMAYLISCSDESITPVDNSQIKADSLAQSIEDNLQINAYISNIGINTDSIRVDSTTGTRYFIIKRGNGALPEFNDILSFHYQGKFIQEVDSLFDTSYESIAKSTDSLQYVEKGIDFNLLISKSSTGKDYEEILDSLNISLDAIGLPLFTNSRTYSPISFNYVEDGSGIANFVTGFKVGLTNLLNLEDANGERLLPLGSKAVILLPSAVGYGLTGSSASSFQVDRIPPNTPILFELDFINIRN